MSATRSAQVRPVARRDRFRQSHLGRGGPRPSTNDSEWIQRGGIQLPPTQPTVLTVAEVADRLRVSKMTVTWSDLLTVREVAAVLNVSKMTVYRLVNAEKLPHFRVETSVRIPADALNRYMQDRYVTQGDRDLPIEELVERSSLGTPEAKAARARVSDETAKRIVDRAAEIGRERQVEHDRQVAVQTLMDAATAVDHSVVNIANPEFRLVASAARQGLWLRARADRIRAGDQP